RQLAELAEVNSAIEPAFPEAVDGAGYDPAFLAVALDQDLEPAPIERDVRVRKDEQTAARDGGASIARRLGEKPRRMSQKDDARKTLDDHCAAVIGAAVNHEDLKVSIRLRCERGETRRDRFVGTVGRNDHRHFGPAHALALYLPAVPCIVPQAVPPSCPGFCARDSLSFFGSFRFFSIRSGVRFGNDGFPGCFAPQGLW